MNLLKWFGENIADYGAADDFSDKIKTFIDDNLLSPQLSLSFVASKLKISEAYLSRIFKKIFGINFNEFVTEKKLDYAHMLLLGTSRTVNDISDELCYSSTQHFISIFKARFGVTPSSLRRGTK